MKTSLLLILLFLINTNVFAQRASEITPNSITLPRLSTTEQNTVPPQQAGNIIYNADEKKLALHDGTNWNYLTANAAASGFQKMKAFDFNESWVVPAGVTKIRAELWGGGNAGNMLGNIGATFTCIGGRGACYALFELDVIPNEALTIEVGIRGENNPYNIIAGGASTIKRGGIIIAGAGLNIYQSSDLEGLLKVVEGEYGKSATFSFQQVDTGVFRKVVQTGAGGGTYPYFNNGGKSITLEYSVPAGTLIGGSGTSYEYGSHGGGGACFHSSLSLGYGSSGFVVIYY
jgi:hypothetical protein